MTMRSVLAVVPLAVSAGLTGCPSSQSCPLEVPPVSVLPQTCTALPGQQVSFPLRLCPTCNQTGATCVVDLSSAASSRDIFLDIKAEACTSDSCPVPAPACQNAPLVCTFSAPTTPATYTVITSSATGGTLQSTLQVAANASPSCVLPI